MYGACRVTSGANFKTDLNGLASHIRALSQYIRRLFSHEITSGKYTRTPPPLITFDYVNYECLEWKLRDYPCDMMHIHTVCVAITTFLYRCLTSFDLAIVSRRNSCSADMYALIKEH